jgi:hypothetical protein
VRSWTVIAGLGLLGSTCIVVFGIERLAEGHDVFGALMLGCGLVLDAQNTRLLFRKPTCRRD